MLTLGMSGCLVRLGRSAEVMSQVCNPFLVAEMLSSAALTLAD